MTSLCPLEVSEEEAKGVAFRHFRVEKSQGEGQMYLSP